MTSWWRAREQAEAAPPGRRRKFGADNLLDVRKGEPDFGHRGWKRNQMVTELRVLHETIPFASERLE
jgi:hypothetical protein